MDIKLTNNSKYENHLTLLSSLIESSDESILCSGWIKPEGIQAIRSAIEAALRKKAKITIISNEFHTKGSSAKIISEWPEVSHFMAKKKHGTIHSKIYYFQTNDSYDAVIGSANITQGGLSSSDELSVHLTGKVGEDIQIRIKEYLDEMQNYLQAQP
ncbi:restriction endonuclease PLD domain-containing protein [Pseudomonas sp. 5Ae-yellow]|uniref:restriction endonuclease PLD domain-containing protein n=1 Tax=Pseudomonas sp. 5Ae-yellow TaxID=2759848 RepID=UPI0015F500B5|nr:phospholipase D family protein [Pseudomonas sp. 5Ae-yellow]MBA6421115.1 phospholipase D family protein [Pseudomonas sp. 5Ae-yellow]|tara:strand:+ start:923 stop:1393 length:471 start_codon:yes stop_codon:yes gene_type:complete